MTEEKHDKYDGVGHEVERYGKILEYYEKNPSEIERNKGRISEAIEGLSKLLPSEEGGHGTIKFMDEINTTKDGLTELLEESN